MKILAFDSTAKSASVALCEDERLLGLYNIDNGLTQSELLLPMAESLLKSLRLSFSNVDLLCASMGPGSFTGVRIGAALVKGIAFGRNIPCVSVSTLEALAYNAFPLSGLIVPVMDARRSQVYTAIFECDGHEQVRCCEDSAIAIKELAERLAAYPEKKIYLVGDGYSVAREGLLLCGIKPTQTPSLLITQNAYSIARVALNKYRANEVCSDSELSPIYLRLPQAERERLEKLNKK